jgi:phosphatidylinositol alpha 1,6-mannosyltransferase
MFDSVTPNPKQPPRVALFADTFHEINGAANVIRRLTDFAQNNNYPFLCVRSGRKTSFERYGSSSVLELKRSVCSVPIDGELKYDPLLWRYRKMVREKLEEFKPDVIHVTGLNDVSQLGFYFTHYMSIPGVASWHTNTHEYAASRLINVLPWLSEKNRAAIKNKVETAVMRGLMKLHFLSQVQLAPNEELVAEIERMTRRPSFLMSRGVDLEKFHPDKRRREDKTFSLGYVGRLRPEKNICFFARVEQALKAARINNYKFIFVGEGSEDKWLEKNLENVELTGVLHGGDLARAYANMDLFLFPSQTDAFGNVVLEAMASGVPAVVMPEGGPKFLIEHEKNGFVAKDEEDFLQTIVNLVKEPERLIKMRCAARRAAVCRSWKRVFESVYEKYEYAMSVSKNVRV